VIEDRLFVIAMLICDGQTNKLVASYCIASNEEGARRKATELATKKGDTSPVIALYEINVIGVLDHIL